MNNTTPNISLRSIALLLLAGAFFFGTACKKDSYSDIPNVYVNLHLDISSTLYMELTHVGGWLNLTGGYKGITVYRSSTVEFVAFERCCPYDPTVPDARVFVDDSGLSLTDPECGSQFLILDGSVIQGPAGMPLKQYRTNFDGDNLHIYN
jgi:hypothetical protein